MPRAESARRLPLPRASPGLRQPFRHVLTSFLPNLHLRGSRRSHPRPIASRHRREHIVMNDIFGIPMAGTMLVLLVILGLCLLRVAWIAWRRPVNFKLGMRNIPRRKAQTTLIVV